MVANRCGAASCAGRGGPAASRGRSTNANSRLKVGGELRRPQPRRPTRGIDVDSAQSAVRTGKQATETRRIHLATGTRCSRMLDARYSRLKAWLTIVQEAPHRHLRQLDKLDDLACEAAGSSNIARWPPGRRTNRALWWWSTTSSEYLPGTTPSSQTPRSALAADKSPATPARRRAAPPWRGRRACALGHATRSPLSPV